MPDTPVRVALLARPGEVRDQLRRALADFGAQLVAEGDPAELDPAAVALGRPGVVVVSLEPAIEDSLERFEGLLAEPDVEVIYDDAEVTRQLDGWDLARWARHFAAKLTGGEVELPPPPGGLDQVPEFDVALEPGAPPTPAQQMDAERLEDYAAESLDLSAWVPSTPSLTEVAVDVAPAASDAADDVALELDIDLAGLELAMAPQDDAPPVAAAAPGADDDFVAVAPAAAATDDFIAADAPAPAAAFDDFLPADTTLELEDAGTASDFAAAGDFAAEDSALEFADADAPLELADAGAPLELQESGAPLELQEADAPLELQETDAPLELADAGATLELDDSDAPPAFAESDAPLEFAESDAPLEFAYDDGADTPLTFASGAADDDTLDLGDDVESLDLGLEVDLAALESPASLPVADDIESLDPAADEPLLADMDLGTGPVKFSNFADEDGGLAQDAGVDDDVAALAAQLEAFEASDQRGTAREPDFANLPETSAPAAETRRPAAPPPTGTPAAPPAKAAGGGGSMFASLELVPMDADVGKMAAADADTPPSPSLAEGHTPRRAGLTLAAEDAVANNQTAAGALFVIAGLGGPDGVRQLLSALPPTLPVPVLLYQHLDTGKHERLVGQLARASQLPLDLAAEGKLAFAGRVAVLQPGIGITRREQNIEFVRTEGLAGVVAAMSAKDSIVLVLSGADPSVVPAVLALGAAGGMMLAQDPASCFDPAAPQAVIAAGAASAPLAELAQKIVERWT